MPMFANAEIPPMDETWMMCPLPWARKYGKAAWGDPERAEEVVSI